jgi:hypothetical protein
LIIFGTGITPEVLKMRALNLKRLFQAIVCLLVFPTIFPSLIYSQENQKGSTIEATLKPDPYMGKKSGEKSGQVVENPDTNFTYEKYADFLVRVSDTSKYIVLPVDEFRKKFDTNKIIIGLRHDVDNDLKIARQFSLTEKNLGFRSTYYILHTADYYLAKPDNKSIHTDSILPILKDMQNNSHFEIGWHNDLVTLQVVYHIDPVNFLHQELEWLRSNGLKITGSASHGSSYCRTYNYLNFYFFHECTWPIVGQFVNNVEIPDGGTKITMKKGWFSDFGLEYEAYFLNNNKYFSDASFVGSQRWDIGMLDLNSLKKGDRVIILLHPIHWHPGSTQAEIKSFSVAGQKSLSIDKNNSTINIVMPYGSSLMSLVPDFSLSPGAYAKVMNSLQTSGVTKVNLSSTVTYRVYAENRSVTRDWIVNAVNARNSAAAIETFSFPGITKSAIIDPVSKTIRVKVYSTAVLSSLAPEFRLSAGAAAFVGSTQQVSNSTGNDFSSPVTFKVVAEDGVTTAYWNIKVEILNQMADFISFILPGMTKPATLDTVFKTIDIEVLNGQPLSQIPALFQISEGAKVYVHGVEQISGLSVNDYHNPVVYKLVSEDSLTTNVWTVSVKNQVLSDDNTGKTGPSLTVYPNPARGKAVFVLRNITGRESRIEMFNSQGVKVYSTMFENVSFVSEEIDLSGFTPSIYIIKCSSVKKPVRFIIN